MFMQKCPQAPKIAIFVDVQNIYYTTRDTFQQQFNYREFWQQISQQGDIVLANAYAIQRSDDQQHKFQKALKHIGFDVKLKPFIQRRDGSAKGDWDVGIAVDVMEMAPEVDIVILLSGDGDFDLLLRKVMSRDKVITHVYGVMALTAQSLINAASEFFPIDRNLLL
tara:strand:- start:153 stop:650 length:498 start_codon:yes stop_codon:yes gene_type:complete